MNVALLWLLAILATVLGPVAFAWGIGSLITLTERGSLALWIGP